MFTFTTFAEPEFMGMHAKDDELLAPRGDFKVTNPKPVYLSAYIHGEAERLVGYDIPVFIDGELGDEMEQDCVMKYGDEEAECVLIQWPTREGGPIMDGRIRHRGLFCLKTDDIAIKYARECAEKRVSCL